MDWNTQKIFQILPFYNTFIERPDIKKIIKCSSTKRTSFL